jgi:tetratricopeptide (TPR) repeat protein
MLGKDEILNLLLQNDYAEFFEALDTHGLNTSEYNQLKQELVGGKTDVYYNHRCKVLTNQFFKAKESQEKKDFEEVLQNPTQEMLLHFLRIYPQGKYRFQVRESLKSFEKQQEEAMKWFKKAKETNNYHLQVNFNTKAIELGYQPLQYAYYNRGLAKVNLEDYQGAIADCDQAIYLQPDYGKAYHNRGTAKHYLKDYKGAVADYDQAIYLQPDYVKAYNNRGLAKVLLQDYQGAITDYSQAIALKDNKIWKVHNYRGDCYYKLGKYQAAIADWEKMKETAPEDYIPFYDYIDEARKKAK